MPVPQLASGARLGPYELVAPLGRGGMGEVWKARDTRLNRIVAVKRLTAHTERFEQEARAIASLNHPHICQIHDVGADYLVLEYIEGKPLQGPLPVEHAVQVAIQIASALEEAHRRGVLHRDLKPANIMVINPTGGSSDIPKVKLLDFGLAKLDTMDPDVTRTAEGTVLGTVPYMAPEQAQGKPLDARSDVFSFGAVFYELLSGRRAFGGTSAAETVSAVLRDDPPPLQVPSALQRIVQRCMAKDPAARFQSMTDVKVALELASRDASPAPAARQPSIAVLPFANLSTDKDNEYFSDGLTEEIINALAHLPGLKVTARTSAFAFRGKEQDIRKIAEALDVRTILEGSVRRAGSRIRVTTQLINAADGYHLWSERYDREMADVFAIQDEIAQAIAAALQIKLSAVLAPRPHTPTLPAYEAFLKARHSIYQAAPESIARGRKYLEQAIAFDPEFATPHSYLGLYFFALAVFGLMPAHDAVPLARASAQKALDIDPAQPEAHAMLGMVAALYDYDWKEAERLFRLATARDPIPPQVRFHYGWGYLLPSGRARDAAQEIERGLKEDPLHVTGRNHLAQCLWAAGRETDAATELHHILELDENAFVAYASLGIYYGTRGMLAEARDNAEKAYALAPWNVYTAGVLAGVLTRIGDVNRAEALLEKLKPGQAYGVPMALAHYHLLCGEIEEAADWVEKAIEQRHPAVANLLRSPLGNILQSSPRWPALAKMMNLPQNA